MIIVMQIWDGDKEKAVETAALLKETYPDFFLGILSNQCDHPKEIEKYADLIHTTTEDVFAVGTGGLAAHELFSLGLEMPGDIIVKIDADTQIHKVENLNDAAFARRRGVFGKMQVARMLVRGEPFESSSINGGALGIKRSTARYLIDDKILLDDALVTFNPSKMSAYIREKMEGREGRVRLSSHDWSIAWACEYLKIPMEYDSLLISAFEHEARFSKGRPNADYIVGDRTADLFMNTKIGLKKELLSQTTKNTEDVTSFIKEIWGNDGIVICKREYETGHLIKKNFTDITEAVEFVEFKDSRHMAITARPFREDGKVQMIVLNIDVPYGNEVDVSCVKTSYGRSHVYMLMEPAITQEQADAIISSATFANVVGSRSATFNIGCRIPATASYSRECLFSDGDKCETIRKLDGVVEQTKKVDRYFSVDEAIEVVSQLSEVCKVQLPVMKEEIVLL